jgi:hypothetical protein
MTGKEKMDCHAEAARNDELLLPISENQLNHINQWFRQMQALILC